MDSLKQSFSAMTEMFNAKMTEFQQDLQKSSSGRTAATTTSLAADFDSFKTFIVSALSTLQQQMDFLRLEMDRQEMRRRRKMLMFHGISESKSEDLTARVTTLVGEHLDLQNFSSSSIKSCYRLGRLSGNKPRPIVVKFAESSVRNKVWFAKTKFKGTGITQSEFLTNLRHDVFLEARKRFGITNCWTHNGVIFVMASDGTRQKVECLRELDEICVVSSVADTAKCPVQSPGLVSKSPDTRLPVLRTKRVNRK